MRHHLKTYLFVGISFFVCNSCENDTVKPQDEKEKETLTIAYDLMFAEGPAYYNGILYFSDIQANKIYTWNETQGLQVYKENSGGANGLYLDKSGQLIICEGSNKRITSIDTSGNTTILADEFEGTPFNEPNDVWVASNGNIYFTDPVFSETLSQSGEYVYCILSSNKQIIKVADDLVKPNGIVGNADGTKLFIADFGASKIYQYVISADGTLNDKKLFTDVQADGLTIDTEENVYAASKSIMIYNSDADYINSIDVDETLTNLFYAETENSKLLFVTTHSNVYQIEL